MESCVIWGVLIITTQMTARGHSFPFPANAGEIVEMCNCSLQSIIDRHQQTEVQAQQKGGVWEVGSSGLGDGIHPTKDGVVLPLNDQGHWLEVLLNMALCLEPKWLFWHGTSFTSCAPGKNRESRHRDPCTGYISLGLLFCLVF